jgi:hypothetical protein
VSPDPRALTDEELVDAVFDRKDWMLTWRAAHEIIRRLSLVPRCPTCGEETSVPHGNCVDCAFRGLDHPEVRR